MENSEQGQGVGNGEYGIRNKAGAEHDFHQFPIPYSQFRIIFTLSANVVTVLA